MSDAYADCIVVPVEEIQDGDVIVGCLRKESEDDEWNRTWERDGVVVGKDKWTLEYIQAGWYLHKFQVRRGGAKLGKMIRGDWNGKCHRCGKGTYTGLIKTEHEGGRCRA